MLRPTIRAWCVCVAMLLTLGCSRGEPPAGSSSTAGDGPAAEPASLPSGPRLFVTNEVSGDLSVIDIGTRRVIATIPLGKRPRGLRLSPDGALLYVTLSGSPMGGPNVDESTLPPPDKAADGIGVVSVGQLRLLRVIESGSDPEQVAVSLDGMRLFVTNEDVGRTSVVDAQDGDVLASIEVGGEPEGVDLRPDGMVVYVTSEEDNQVSVIDAIGLTRLDTIPVGPRPRSTAFLPDSSRAYVPSENGSSISVIDAQQHRVILTIELDGGPLLRPMGTVVSPDGAALYVTTGRGGHVIMIDTATNQPMWSVEVGERPWGIAVSSDGKTVFTANGPSNDVSIVDVASKRVVARIEAGQRPWAVAYVPG